MRSALSRVCGLILITGLSVPTAEGQGAPAPVAPATVISSRSPWVDFGIFVALAGGAVYAVCRGSRRV